MMSNTDTIYALATGHGKSALSVIRISGPQTRTVLSRMAGGVPEPRLLVLKKLVDSHTKQHLDQALVVFFKGPQSFSGEDQAEFHIHGGLAVQQAVLQALGQIEGCRPAQAGEFTKRALLNHKMDLSAVEGLADLIDSETEQQRRQAFRQMEGVLGQGVEACRSRLIEAQALIEALIDFSDEGDVPDNLSHHILKAIDHVLTFVDQGLAGGRTGERLRDGFHAVLAGAPNAGKSSLLNYLARRDVAIVSAHAGTTRDALEVRCNLDGWPVTFIDTAGLRDAQDPIEEQGIARSRQHIKRADLVLWLQACNEPDTDISLDADVPVVKVVTKADLAGVPFSQDVLATSVQTGFGMDKLIEKVIQCAARSLGQGDALLTRERHRLAFEEAKMALLRGQNAFAYSYLELAAEDIRLASRSLGEITGFVNVEQVLDKLFSNFCIGK